MENNQQNPTTPPTPAPAQENPIVQAAQSAVAAGTEVAKNVVSAVTDAIERVTAARKTAKAKKARKPAKKKAVRRAAPKRKAAKKVAKKRKPARKAAKRKGARKGRKGRR